MPYYPGEYDESGNTTYDTRDTSYRDRDNDRNRRDNDEGWDVGGGVMAGGNSSSGTSNNQPRDPKEPKESKKEEKSFWESVWDKVKNYANEISENKEKFKNDRELYHNPSTTKAEREAIEKRYRDEGRLGTLSLLTMTDAEIKEREEEERRDRADRNRENSNSSSSSSVFTPKILTICTRSDTWEKRANQVFKHIFPRNAETHNKLAEIATHIDGIPNNKSNNSTESTGVIASTGSINSASTGNE